MDVMPDGPGGVAQLDLAGRDFLFERTDIWTEDGRLRHEAFKSDRTPLVLSLLDAAQAQSAEAKSDCARFFPNGSDALSDWHANMPAGCPKYRGVHGGRLLSFKFTLRPMSNGRADVLFQDRTLSVRLERSYLSCAEQSKATKTPIFLCFFRDSADISLGYYQAFANEGATYSFRPCEDQVDARTLTMERLAQQVSPAPEGAPRGRSRSPRRRDARASSSQPRAAMTARKTAFEGHVFDSELELLHFLAARDMGLEYQPHPGEFHVGDETGVSLQYATYKPDARTKLRVQMDPTAGPQDLDVLLEIKPTPPTQQENCKLYALSKQRGEFVLCIYGSMCWVRRSEEMTGAEGYLRPRHAPFQAKLYVPRLPHEDPLLYGGLRWRRDERGFFLGTEPSRPSREELDAVRATYSLADQRMKAALADGRAKSIA